MGVTRNKLTRDEKIPWDPMAELSSLSKLQNQALQQESYLRMSEAQRAAYDRRRLRIGELWDRLKTFTDKHG